MARLNDTTPTNITEAQLQEWQDAVRDLAAMKGLELTLRNRLLKELPAGKSTLHGVQLTVTIPTRTAIDVEVLDEIWDDLPANEKAWISYTPKMSTKSAKEVRVDSKIVQAITLKSGQGSIKVK